MRLTFFRFEVIVEGRFKDRKRRHTGIKELPEYWILSERSGSLLAIRMVHRELTSD